MADQSQEADDRRKHPRAPLHMLVQFRFDTLEDFISEYSMDISMSGIFIHTTEPRPVGTPIWLQFTLKDGSTIIEALGKVARMAPPGAGGGSPGMGIEFESFDERTRDVLTRLVAKSIEKKGDSKP